MATTDSPYLIAGQIPFTQGGNPFQGAQTGLAGLAGQYGQGYNNALAQNAAMYENVLKGYQQTIGNQVTAQDAIGKGYTDLYNQVLGGISGIEASQKQQIADTYAMDTGRATQSLIDRGLGNTTVSDSVRRGLRADEQKAQTGLANQIAALNAGYQSQLGLAGLGQQREAAAANTQLADRQLQFMASPTAAYPDANQYNQLFRQQGEWDQANADRQQLAQLGNKSFGVAAPTVGSGSRGSSSGSSMSTPFTGSRADSSMATYYGGGTAFTGYGSGYTEQLPTNYDIGGELEAMGLGPAGDSYDDQWVDPSWDESMGTESYYDPWASEADLWAGTEWDMDLSYDQYADYGGG